MRKNYARIALTLLMFSFFVSCATQKIDAVYQRGIASWYGPHLQHHKTANGEKFDMHKLTAAHPTLPFGSMVRVRNVRSGKEVLVRINDRGPFAGGRIIDLSRAAAVKLEMLKTGEDEVELYLVSN